MGAHLEGPTVKATSVSVALSNVAAWAFGLLCGVAFGVWVMGEVRGWKR